ncbi:homocysteine S-methyltransferase [Streptomyces spectabilis]|uniref:Homocysteine S-methyltransferase n=1 Tax=Streptomyces spectabilis TaxID=68270 RepID=A0A516RI11_STRST|nr:homocysteine S-methyltransferase [Streptomyces spectabilis]QDQ15292.1 homocysteine S-methyltransferase [Streptomyces spectabilis]
MNEAASTGAGTGGGGAAGLAAALARGPLVLDGGLSNQLAAAGHDLSDDLWSARLLAERPDAVRAAHRAYYEAGADVVITASYQATFEGFARHGIDAVSTAELLRLSVTLAREAAGLSGAPRPLWVAASAGPYGAMLADGSEYRGGYGLSVAALERFHRPRLEVLCDAAPDVLALETVPDTDEARALLRAVRGLGVPAWLSYSVSGARTRAGQPLAEAFALAADADDVLAVGVNCCDPRDADAAVSLAARVTGKPVVVYPNSGETWNAATRSWQGPSRFTAAQVETWRAAGARLIGGCCRVGPEAIAEVARRLRGPGA